MPRDCVAQVVGGREGGETEVDRKMKGEGDRGREALAHCEERRAEERRGKMRGGKEEERGNPRKGNGNPRADPDLTHAGPRPLPQS